MSCWKRFILHYIFSKNSRKPKGGRIQTILIILPPQFIGTTNLERSQILLKFEKNEDCRSNEGKHVT